MQKRNAAPKGHPACLSCVTIACVITLTAAAAQADVSGARWTLPEQRFESASVDLSFPALVKVDGSVELTDARQQRQPGVAPAPAARVVREYEGYYLDGTIGASFSSLGALAPGVAVNAAGGYRVDFVRLEGDLGFRYHNIESVSGDALIFTLMANGVLDIDISNVLDGVDLYAGGGVGLGVATADADEFDDTQAGVAFQAKGGISYRLREDLNVLVGYRWMLIDFPESGNEQFHTAELGVRLRF